MHCVVNLALWIMALFCGNVNVLCVLEIFFGFCFLLDFSCFNVSVECVHGFEGFTHPWEGREALGEGLSWAQQCSREPLLLDRRGKNLWIMGSIEAIVLLL